jgi:hypothetical protein
MATRNPAIMLYQREITGKCTIKILIMYVQKKTKKQKEVESECSKPIQRPNTMNVDA